MKAMILAAGRGERMRPLTDGCPKPLLKAGKHSLIEYHLMALHQAGVRDIVINTGWLGEQFPDVLGDGSKFGMAIQYSHEGYPALETAGGIIKALPHFGGSDFIVVNGDIYTDYDYSRLKLEKGCNAHVVLITNPVHHPNGDFSLDSLRVVHATKSQTYTYSGIAVYNERFFNGVAAQRLALKPLLDSAIDKHYLSGEVFKGEWRDIGTVERLHTLNKELMS